MTGQLKNVCVGWLGKGGGFLAISGAYSQHKQLRAPDDWSCPVIARVVIPENCLKDGLWIKE